MKLPGFGNERCAVGVLGITGMGWLYFYFRSHTVIPFTIIVTAAYYTFHSLKTLALPGYSSLQPIYLLYINSDGYAVTLRKMLQSFEHYKIKNFADVWKLFDKMLLIIYLASE
jgi:hypothetical protein